ncbi:DUF2213 domain-containing protein [Paraburkholderia sp. BR13439]|uniref:DUF2213 domain-containing protein n=1 Tax=Paraburkholderia sp. BR13439 TaxID=3236996 RepID=UPI0034D01317
MALQIRPGGGVVFTDCRLFRAGVIECSGFELGLSAVADKRKWFNTYYSAAALSDEPFLKAFEGLPVILGHLNEVEARHIEGKSSAARFDGEWVVADLTMTTNAIAKEIFVHHVVDLSVSINGDPVAWNGTTTAAGIEQHFEYSWVNLVPVHIALLNVGRVEGAALNFDPDAKVDLDSIEKRFQRVRKVAMRCA